MVLQIIVHLAPQFNRRGRRAADAILWGALAPSHEILVDPENAVDHDLV
jgi:hypothetical protein